MAALLVSIMTVKSPTSSVDALPDGLTVVLVWLQIIDIIVEEVRIISSIHSAW